MKASFSPTSITRLLPTVLICLLGSCQSYNSQIEGLVSVYEKGEFEEAASVVESGDLEEAYASKTDGLLFMLEAGKVLQDAGLYRESISMFERASARMEHFDLQASVSVSEELVSTVSTQASRDYRGTDYDRILLEIYEVLNYLAINDFGEAMVHVRRAYRRQAEAVARNASEIEARQKENNATGSKALQSEEYRKFEQSLNTLATDAYADFVNPMATFLSAVLLREEGTNSNALVDLRKLVSMLPNNSYLPLLLEEFEAGPSPVPNRFYVIFENGLAPARREWSLTLPTPNGWSRIAVPMIVPQPTEVKHLLVRALDDSLELATQQIASIDSIVASDFKANLASMIWRIVISQVAKETATYALAKQDSSGIASVLGSIYKVASAGADLRTWRTPGSEFQIAFGEVPEDGRLSLDLITSTNLARGRSDVILPPARTHFIFVRVPRLSNIQPRVFSLGSTISN